MATSLKLDSEMAERVKRLADAKQRTAESLLREAVEEYISRAEARDETLKAGIAAWEHYKTTGLHVTGEEMEEWMLKIEAGEDVPPPECHV